MCQCLKCGKVYKCNSTTHTDMSFKCLCNQKGIKNELCEVGQKLWNDTNACEEFSQKLYDDYRRHIIKCKVCQKGLGGGYTKDIIAFIEADIELREG